MIMPYASYVVSNVLWNLDKLIPEAVINADIMIPFHFIRIVSDIINVYTLLHLYKVKCGLIFAVGLSLIKTIVDLSFFLLPDWQTQKISADLCKKTHKVKDCFVKSSTSLSYWQKR